MIVIRVMFQIQATAQSGFLGLIQSELITAREMPGCLTFGIFEDPEYPCQYLLYEEWEDLSYFEAYKQSAAFQKIGANIFPLMVGAPSSAYFEAQILEQN